MKPLIQVQAVSQRFSTASGEFLALQNVSFDIHEGETVSLIGHSGCGKSTLLNLIAGITLPTEGGLICDNREIAGPGPERAVVFQNHSLLPWLTCFDNVALAVDHVFRHSMSKAERREWIEHNLDRVQMGHALHKRPGEISGGMKQRVGIARALAMKPKVLLMDEPFGALDPVTRGALQAEMTRIHRILGRTIVLVTHDIDEALRLADHLVLMDHGEVVQQGSPLELLTWPKNDFVREFFGRSELGVRLLSLRTVSDYMRREEVPVSGEPLQAQMSLRDALSAFVARQCEVLPVSDARGTPCGTLHFRDLLAGEVTREGTA